MEKQEAIGQLTGLSPGNIYRKTLDDFLKYIPEGNKPLYNESERKNITERAIGFGQMYNNLMLILRGYGNLSSKEERMGILSKIPNIRREAIFWTRKSDSRRDFAREIDEAVTMLVPENDRKMFAEYSKQRHH